MNDSSTIWVVGSLNADLVQQVQAFPRPGETVTGTDLLTIPGGKGANQACASAKLGGRVRMIGNVGHDDLGGFLLDSLSSSGVDIETIARVEASTGTASIFVLENGENAIVVSPGANATLHPDDVRERMSEIRAGDFLLCQLETPLATVDAALMLAREAGATTILDPAPAKALPPELLARVDFLTPNESEARTILESDVDPAPEIIARALNQSGPSSIVLKLGGQGCLCRHDGQEIRIDGVSVEVKDTTAAGDTFNGALAVGLAEAQPLHEALQLANAAAALSVTREGAQTSIPNRDEVESFLAAHR